MIDRVNKVLIGKNISRTASAVLTGASQAAAEGEIFVLDKNKNILTPGATIDDTDTIYIAEILGDTYSYVTESTGTSVTGVKKYIVSDPIQGNKVKSYIGRAYTAITEQVVTIDGSTFAPVVGTEYAIRVVYTDTFERPGQVTATYRVISTSTSSDTLWQQFVTKINKHVNRRVIASGTTELVLTGRAMPFDRTDDVNAIDEYYQVTFKAFLFSNNFGDSTVTYTTRPVSGNGTWQKVRDAEKKALSYKGIMNRTIFPVQMPAMRTVKSTNYNTIVIEHDKTYTAPDSYNKDTRLTTEIYIPTTAGQMANVLSVLNPWMNSTPNALPSVSF
jgi:hypothetical protein